MIRAVQPDVVLVELCQYRVSMLRMDENTLLKEAKEINLEKVQQAIKQVRLLGSIGKNCSDIKTTIKAAKRAPNNVFIFLHRFQLRFNIFNLISGA